MAMTTSEFSGFGNPQTNNGIEYTNLDDLEDPLGSQVGLNMRSTSQLNFGSHARRIGNNCSCCGGGSWYKKGVAVVIISLLLVIIIVTGLVMTTPDKSFSALQNDSVITQELGGEMNETLDVIEVKEEKIDEIIMEEKMRNDSTLTSTETTGPLDSQANLTTKTPNITITNSPGTALLNSNQSLVVGNVTQPYGNVFGMLIQSLTSLQRNISSLEAQLEQQRLEKSIDFAMSRPRAFIYSDELFSGDVTIYNRDESSYPGCMNLNSSMMSHQIISVYTDNTCIRVFQNSNCLGISMVVDSNHDRLDTASFLDVPSNLHDIRKDVCKIRSVGPCFKNEFEGGYLEKGILHKSATRTIPGRVQIGPLPDTPIENGTSRFIMEYQRGLNRRIEYVQLLPIDIFELLYLEEDNSNLSSRTSKTFFDRMNRNSSDVTNLNFDLLRLSNEKLLMEVEQEEMRQLHLSQLKDLEAESQIMVNFDYEGNSSVVIGLSWSCRTRGGGNNENDQLLFMYYIPNL